MPDDPGFSGPCLGGFQVEELFFVNLASRPQSLEQCVAQSRCVGNSPLMEQKRSSVFPGCHASARRVTFIWSHLRNKPFRALCCCCRCLLSTQPSIRTDINSAECQPQCWVPPEDHLIRAAQVGAVLIPHKTIIVLACCTDIETDTETKAQRG